MDIQLPGIDGVEALAGCARTPGSGLVPVLALTAQAMEGDRERFLPPGFDGYLSKPVDVTDFVATVKRYCEGQTDERRRRRGSSWSTTCPRTCGC